MAKGKGGKKDKKEKKGKKDEPDPNAVTEVDKTFYELTIADLNRKLARLRTLTQELEVRNEELIQEKEKLDEDRNDVIIFLKRTLIEKTDEINELEERVTALQESQQNETEKYEEQIADMRQEYKEMHDQLKSENKLLEGKLNALEEFRSTRDELMRKFENQENEMEAQEKRHKRELYEIERKFILKRDQLKKDMEAKIRQLSTEFHNATELRIAATTHRAIRENVAINNELDVLLTTQQRLYNENCYMKKKDTSLKQQCELHETEKKEILSKSRVQLKIIERLTDDHKYLSDQLKTYKAFEDEVYHSRNEMAALNEKLKNLEYTSRILEQNLHHVRCDRVTLQTELMYVKEENDHLQEVLIEAVDCISDAMALGPESDTSLVASKRENLLSTLFTLLTKAREQKLRLPSLETVDSVEATYVKGDLGFIPKPVELRSKVPIKRNMESQTATSFQEYLEFGEPLDVVKAKAPSAAPKEFVPGVTKPPSTTRSEQDSVLFFDEREIVDEEQSRDSKEFLLLLEEQEEVEAATTSPAGAAPSPEGAAVSPATEGETTDAEKESPTEAASPEEVPQEKAAEEKAAPEESPVEASAESPEGPKPEEGAETPANTEEVSEAVTEESPKVAEAEGEENA